MAYGGFVLFIHGTRNMSGVVSTKLYPRGGGFRLIEIYSLEKGKPPCTSPDVLIFCLP